MSLFKKQSHQPDRKQVQYIQDTPKHPVLQFRRKNKNKKHDHLDNYVQIRPFADAEFSWLSFTSYSDQFDELYKLYSENKLEEARELCGKDEQDIWKKLYNDASNKEDALKIVRVYKWLVDADELFPKSKRIFSDDDRTNLKETMKKQYDYIVKEEEERKREKRKREREREERKREKRKREREREEREREKRKREEERKREKRKRERERERERKKLGYNKENPWSEEKERKRKEREDKYINKHGEAPSEEFWQRYWLGYNEKNPWSEEKERKRKDKEDEYRLTYGNAPPYDFWPLYWEKLIRKRERKKRESERKKLSERMKLGYNKENPRSLDFEYNRALFEDEYRLTYGNAPPSNFDWQKWWKQKKKKIMEKMEKR
jgi:hypothetical protein